MLLLGVFNTLCHLFQNLAQRSDIKRQKYLIYYLTSSGPKKQELKEKVDLHN